jgi:uncharacterized protein
MHKKYLFFFVHPSKYHLFKYTINELINKGNQVDIVIITKDVLEPLIINEGWKYSNIFPEGRRSVSNNKYSILFSTLINFFKTIWRLWKYTKNKEYDVFITDDCLSIIGWLKKVPSYMFIDDDISVVPENSILYRFATNIISPNPTNLGRFNKKKIGYNAYHELAYLHPKYFKPDESVVSKLKEKSNRYFIIRLVSLTASHDINKSGIDDHRIDKLIDVLKDYGQVFISSERELNEKYRQYKLIIKPEDIAHVLFYADMFIGDSQTMNTEASLLGTPAIRFNDFVGKISTMNEIEFNYQLSYGFSTDNFDGLLDKVTSLVKNKNLKNDWELKRQKMISEKIDLNSWLINFFEVEVKNQNI